ncbi:MAG: multifunctional oxoglutarate decarboxylase/oxoglutarate dehydrogenase thiamine pyrophosphate-binding subunit/dihydrolipoyllysine-residue succinyltransferase subunit [Solirubrobacterales bacterium]
MPASETVQITMPQMGESVSEGVVLAWHKQEGEWVDKDETIVEISTDKVDAEVPSPVAGKLTKILAAADETVAVGDALAEIEAGEPAPGGTSPSKPEATAAPRTTDRPSSAPQSAASASVVTAASAAEPDGTATTPVARRVAASHGVDLSKVSGTGTGGRIVKEDVLAFLNGGDGAAARTSEPSEAAREAATVKAGAQPLRGADAALARYMTQSLQVPTATSFRTISVATLDRRRRQLGDALKLARRDMKVSFTHLIAYAITRAMRDHPAMGHSFAEIDGKPSRIVPDHVNLGLAVDVRRDDGSRTLIVPVIKETETLGFRDFRAAYEALIASTRDGSLSPDELQGASITLTNPGGIGTVASVPRLMAGQGCIIAIGAIGPPAGFPDGEKVMTMTSTYDHRVIQGAESGSFLGRIEELLRGHERFYEDVFESLALEAPALPPSPQPRTSVGALPASEEMLSHVHAATSLVKAHRTHGHLAARLDPLGSEPTGDPALSPETVGLTPDVMEQIPAWVLRVEVPGETLTEALPHLRDTYCGTIAYELEHIPDHDQRVWLRETIESGRHRTPLSADEKRRLLTRLADVEAFEVYLHKHFLGQKTFSIEGIDMLVPMLDETFELTAEAGAREAFIGMAHRGRLNVLAHAVGRPYESILAEFEGEQDIDVLTARPRGGTGDVKYHQGASGVYTTPSGRQLEVKLASNPSHLEFVDPVVQGHTRARQTDRSGAAAKHDPTVALPILIHGDAAFPGQGVVAETLNLEALDGYSTGGTIHIIANNQIGFTTEPEESRATRYASDLAKGFDMPIIHVNADDPEACMAAVRVAMAYRRGFSRGVVIDLIGYRRFGHNETDEPAYTQPQMYERISNHPPVRQIYAKALIAQEVITPEEVERELIDAQRLLAEAHEAVKMREDTPTAEQAVLDRTQSVEPDTSYSVAALIDLNRQLFAEPAGFEVHRKLAPQRAKRATIEPESRIDWGQAEAIALATLLVQGVPLRLTGQDTVRGTFSQRHLTLVDAKTGRRHTPIQSLDGAKAPLELYNSPLSEMGALGFEYGYGVEAPDMLVIWEAQFGDFVNAGQVIVDQFIVSGLAKWGSTSRLTLLLPHGYEGAGPEHSSAREERFLTLAAEGNIRVANVTTPAQHFHLLRRQALVAKARPLIVFTPKSLLRHPTATSALSELAEGSLQRVIDDPHAATRRDRVTRLLLCSGRIYYDLTGSDLYENNERVAVARVEVLYPFPLEQIRALIDSYPSLTEVAWVQEEPKNMGAKRFMFTRELELDLIPEGIDLAYVGRPYRASPGEGYPADHGLEQERILREALEPVK